KVLKTMIGYDIVPSAVRNRSGAVVPDESPLESRISLPELRRSTIQTLKLLCEAATYSSGRKVDVGVVRDGMDNQIVQLGASNEPARNVLMRLIASRAW